MNFKFSGHQKYLSAFHFSSLTDIVMLLLIFFLLTSSFVITRGMNITLPKTAVGQPPLRKTITVTIEKDKLLYLNNDRIAKEKLALTLAGLMQQDKEQQIVVRADKDLILQDVIEILDIAKSVGATRLFIATEAAKEVK
jgi:biopolymer transport protein ExbD